MIKTENYFLFNRKEITMLHFALGLRMRDITENYSNKQMMKLCKKEIALLEQITETL